MTPGERRRPRDRRRAAGRGRRSAGRAGPVPARAASAARSSRARRTQLDGQHLPHGAGAGDDHVGARPARPPARARRRGSASVPSIGSASRRARSAVRLATVIDRAPDAVRGRRPPARSSHRPRPPGCGARVERRPARRRAPGRRARASARRGRARSRSAPACPTRSACCSSGSRTRPTVPSSWPRRSIARTWPSTWASPTAIESSPAVTLNRWPTACSAYRT